jgi:mRNA interferase MazF
MEEIIKNIVKWIKLKIRIHLSDKEKNLYFQEREVWWASLGVNIGFEEDGKHKNFERPVLILRKFNKNIVWVLPQTSQNKSSKFYYQLEYKGNNYSVILSQLSLISSKRLLRKIRVLKDYDFKKIRKAVKDLI